MTLQLQSKRATAAVSTSDDEDDPNDEPCPRVILEVGSQNPVLEVVGEGALVAERPDRVDDPQDPGESEHGPGEEEPAGATFLGRVDRQLIVLRR